MIQKRKSCLGVVVVLSAVLTTQSFAAIQEISDGSELVTKRELVIVVGAEGEVEFASQFTEWGAKWQKIGADTSMNVTLIHNPLEREVTDNSDSSQPTNGEALVQLQECLLRLRGDQAISDLWVVLIGHGTFDGKTAKFNLVGPDVSPEELRAWLPDAESPIRQVVLNCASASGPFVQALSARNRIVITSTKSGAETNFARFGGFLVEAISNPEAVDLDKDGRSSLLEAFLIASRETNTFYDEQSRLATEHALLDDNGDRLGTAADWFDGIRVVGNSKDGREPDGTRANQVFLRTAAADSKIDAESLNLLNEMEIAVEAFIRQKASMPEELYYQQLERLLLDFARASQSR